jgi:dihydroneopterin triphosphate diphosphatase
MQKQYRLPIQVLVYCYRRNASGVEYLMLRRTPKYGAFWQGVTGAPDVGETLLEGAVRELKEETQIVPKSLDQVDFGYSFPVEDDWKWAYDPDVTRIDEFVFLAEIADNVEPVLSFEHDSFEWATVDRAIKLLKWPNNKNALIYCHQLLQQTCGR